MNLLKNFSFVSIPGLYLYYLNKRNTVQAKEQPADNSESIERLSDQKTRIDKCVRKPVTCFRKSRDESIRLIETYRVVQNAPGVACAVSYRGRELWAIGNGLADIETGAPCTENSVMRIASISKSLTMLLLGKLLEEGKLDLDKPINEYLDKEKWPQKYFNKQKVDLTLRQLVSHLAGVRSYSDGEKEMYFNESFKDVYDSLRIFKDDDLMSEPGTKYLYSTFGFTLISAVIQSVLEKSETFEDKLLELLKRELRMNSIYLDTNEMIIPDRAKYYMKKKKKLPDETTVYGELINVPEVDCSYKRAGGGFLGSVHDLLKFGNAMLYSYKTTNGILKQETMQQFWTANELTKPGQYVDIPFKYAMGFQVSSEVTDNKYKRLKRRMLNKIVFHTGGAVGVTSILVIYPEEEIVICLMTNLHECPGLGPLSFRIAQKVMQNVIDSQEAKH